MSNELDILHALRVKGLANPVVLGALSGVPVDQLEADTRPLIEAGYVLFRGGKMPGYMLTAAGKEQARDRLAVDPATVSARDALAAFDQEFLPLNGEFKQICHRWQMKSADQPNDHTDADYDAAVVADLAAFHDRFVPVLEKFAGVLPRFGRYAPRLAAALVKVQDGDPGAFARPMYDSYHDIWMELHNDVVLSLGRGRGAADEQGH